MTAPHQHIPPPTSTRDDSGPGRRLHDARLAAGLSVDEVAARLHLDSGTIGRIEADDYASLPGPTFVRGYLRAYARLMNLPPAPVVEAFDGRGLEPPPLVADIASRSTQARSGDFPVRVATYLIVAGLAALVVVWWQNQGGEIAVPEHPGPGAVASLPDSGAEETLGSGRLQDAEAEASTAGDTEGTGSPRDGAAPRGATEAAASASGEAGPGAPESGAPASQASAPAPVHTGLVATSAPAAKPPRPGSDQRSAEDASTQIASAASSAAVAAGQSSTEVVGATTGPDTLKMRFGHDSWVEVYGQDGARLYYNLARNGQTVTVRGTAPFRVLLGYAKDVQVEYNGAPFDQTPYIRHDIARFELGGEGATHTPDDAEPAVAQTPELSSPGR